MVTNWCYSINRVAPAADIPATLIHSCRVSGGTGGIAAVTVNTMFWFGLGRHRCYFILVRSVSFWVTRFPLPCLVFFLVPRFFLPCLVLSYIPCFRLSRIFSSICIFLSAWLSRLLYLVCLVFQIVHLVLFSSISFEKARIVLYRSRLFVILTKSS